MVGWYNFISDSFPFSEVEIPMGSTSQGGDKDIKFKKAYKAPD